MSLITCPKCGKEVSDRVEKCRYCKYKYNTSKGNYEMEDIIDKALNTYAEAKFGYTMWVSLAMIIVIPYLLIATPRLPDAFGLISAGIFWVLFLTVGIYKFRIYLKIKKNNKRIQLEQEKFAQQGDAPEPATNASPASQQSIPPAR